MGVDGTGGAKTRWIKKSYPEISREELSLVPKKSLIPKKDKVGLNE